MRNRIKNAESRILTARQYLEMVMSDDTAMVYQVDEARRMLRDAEESLARLIAEKRKRTA